MKKLLICGILLACSLTGTAQTFFDVDGIRYMIEDDHAVVARQDCELTGDFEIPATVTYGETEYPVTRLMSPDDSESGGSGAFQGCEITSISLPASITDIPNNAFADCQQLSSIVLQGPVTRIGESSFSSCEALTTINMPDELTVIDNFAFYRCNSLSSITIPKRVTTIGYLALADCSSLSSFNVAEGNSYYSSENGVLFNKNKTILLQYPQAKSETSYIIPNSVTSITYMAFFGCSILTSVTIPNSMKNIGEYAFESCSGLTSITIPDKVTTIEQGTFCGCSGLTSITIPKSVTSLGNSAFEGCGGLVEVSIGSNVQTFNSSVFKGCQNLSEVWCYATVVPTVESDAFAESNYTNATLYVRETLLNEYENTEIWNSFKDIKNISSLQDYAPYHTIFVADGIRYMTEDDDVVIARQDKELTGDIVIPATVTYGNAEYNVTRLMSPDDSESGGGGAFQECEITSISLPASITEIPDNTFNHCRQLSSVVINGPVARIGGHAFEGCEALTTIDLPDEVTEMGDAAFQGTGLTAFTIPAGVTVLNMYVLADTKITYLEIPATVNRLDRNCFATYKTDEQGEPLKRTVKMFQRDCRLINDDESMPDRGTEFGDMTTIDLLVPAGCKVLYQEYSPWLNMHSITEYGEDTGEVLVPDQRHVIIDDIRYMLKNGEAYVDIQPESLSGEISIPDKVTYENIDYPVTKVMGSYWSMWYGDTDSEYYHFSGAFEQTQVTKITLPASIKTIEHHAFSRAQKLQEVVISEGVTEIGTQALSYCPELTTINIPSTVTILSRGILRECPKLKTLTLHEGLTTIDWEALWGTGIETLTIPSTCTLLGYQALELPNLKTLYVNVKEPKDIEAIGYYGNGTMNGTVFGHDSDQAATNERLSKADLIVPLGCAESYEVQAPWFNFRSITDQGSPYLKLNGSVFAAPEGSFTVEDESPVFEDHSGWYVEDYTKGLAIDHDTKIKFTTTAPKSWVYIYLFSSNTSKVKVDGTVVNTIGEDQSTSSYTFYRYDVLVDAGEHVITCDDYTDNQMPCMFLLRVQDISGDYYQPKSIGVNIDGINFVLEEKTVEGQDEPVRTATIARQKTSLSGDIVIPAKVSYAKTVLQGSEWVTLEAHDYDVTEMVAAGFEIREAPGIFRTTDGAFQECAIMSISLPATLTTIPAGAFNGCQQLKTVTLAEGITTIGGGAFANCTSLEDIYLPETITDMSDYYIFGNCPSLKKVNIPKLVTSLGNGCFMRSGIETFIIPKNVTSLGEACFAAMWEETSVKTIKICHDSYSDGSISFPENMFFDLSGITLIVPEGTKESLYSQVYPWKDFDNIIEYSDQHDEHQYNAYRVEYEEEVIEEEPEEEKEEEKETPPAQSRRRAPEKKTIEVTAGFTPSGVTPELPTEVEKDGKKYTVTLKETLATMPAKDVVLKVILTLVGGKGDVNSDGVVNAEDIVEVVNYIMGTPSPSGKFNLTSADANEDGTVNAADIVTIVNIIMGNL